MNNPCTLQQKQSKFLLLCGLFGIRNFRYRFTSSIIQILWVYRLFGLVLLKRKIHQREYQRKSTLKDGKYCLRLSLVYRLLAVTSQLQLLSAMLEGKVKA